ncbi:exosortase/archaeosortase family protein [Stieleria sp. ICT_E10.1]|uniref:exosortase/archaeosortase family protein n=1 Tax=Stieleria sedimenti TaxID=2976331 RepID=UPI00217F6B6D|nr:exosortase/archaeosortase family protein [Stieleria sedimenti]MCS7466781.1 exosortase/archaeosortase family protein [Stieleria sedimenti]
MARTKKRKAPGATGGQNAAEPGRARSKKAKARSGRGTGGSAAGKSGDRGAIGRAALGDKPYARARTASELVAFPGPSSWPGAYWHVVAGLSLVFLYSYWPTIRWMADSWINEPDYSHGWAVPVLAGMICYYRAESFPGASKRSSWAGLSLIMVAIFMRLVSRFTYTDFLDGWSILPMVAGAVWCLLGFAAMRWALPAIGFLFFAIPMPYQAESMLSWQLQGVATDLSTVFLRIFGQPAVAEGHVVWVGNERLSIEQACSGLRIFVGMGAFAVFWASANTRAWSDKIVILVAAIPAAIFVNSARIVLIGFGYQLFDDASARRWIHDLSGIAMIFASFGIMWLVSVYWQKLYAPVKKLTAKEILRESGFNYAQSADGALESPVEAS